jgi:hypothetical protein
VPKRSRIVPSWEPCELVTESADGRAKQARASVTVVGSQTYFIWADRTGWNVGWEKDPYLDAIYASRSDLKTRKDAELVVEALVNGLSDQLDEHHYEVDTYEEGSEWRASWTCLCGLVVRDLGNAGEAAASARRHWRAVLQDQLALIE